MNNWRDTILGSFSPDGDKLTVVYDPDYLLTEESIVNTILQNGYEILLYEDPIAFRYTYEANYRAAWDAGKSKNLVVLVQTSQAENQIPYDILSQAMFLQFTLYEIFPDLSYPVIENLDQLFLDELWQAYKYHHTDDKLGERETKEFVLTHCYDVKPQFIKTPVELMKVLIARHYQGIQYPEIIDNFFIDELRRQSDFSEFPLERIVPDRQAFFAFLQAQWLQYLTVSDDKTQSIVPFENSAIRVYLDNLFLEGLLQPVEIPTPRAALPDWAYFGIVCDTQQAAKLRFTQLLELSENKLPDNQASYRAWQNFAVVWAETVVLRWQLNSKLAPEQIHQWEYLHQKIEACFADWLIQHFGALASLSPHPRPVMGHHIPQYLNTLRNNGEVDKIALLLLDGLSMDQWFIVQHELNTIHPDWRYDISPIFTWIPSLTPVCRQAIFAGKPPYLFPESLYTTSKDKIHWSKFWCEHNTAAEQVQYWLGIAADVMPWLEDTLLNQDLNTIGLVLSDVDNMVHGGTMGTQGVHQQLHLWAEQGKLSELITNLAANDYTVFITSDHGNVQATGIGIPKEGVLVTSKGSRARFYASKSFRADAHQNLTDTIQWPGMGLPPGNEILLPAGLSAFANHGEMLVTHGGIALEEIIVPFVKVITGVPNGS